MSGIAGENVVSGAAFFKSAETLDFPGKTAA
jgi:hypothetical protein